MPTAAKAPQHAHSADLDRAHDRAVSAPGSFRDSLTSEYQTLNPVREQVVRIAQTDTDRRDVFLCHAWDDRQGAALDLYNLLIGLDVKVWFSEKDVPLGTPLLRQIDKGLAKSRAGIVLVTPALLKSLESEGSRTRNCPHYSLPTESSRSRTAPRSRLCGT